MGEAAVVESGQIQLVACSLPAMTPDPAFYECAGLQPDAALAVMAKSMTGWMAAFGGRLGAGNAVRRPRGLHPGLRLHPVHRERPRGSGRSIRTRRTRLRSGNRTPAELSRRNDRDPSTTRMLLAAARQRRIIFQDDILANDAFRRGEVGPSRLDRLIAFYMSRLEAAPNQIDSVWHEWGEGNTAVWPSEVLPRTENVFPRWWEAGIDPVRVLLDETRQRGREVFFSYRINGSDNDDLFDPPHPLEGPVPLKARHPDWLIHKWHVYWDFRREEVRGLKLEVLREVRRDVRLRRHLRRLRAGPCAVSRGGAVETPRPAYRLHARGPLRPARDRAPPRAGRTCWPPGSPKTSRGAGFDGIDVETWVAEGVVDILAIGTRTAAADVAGFRALTSGTPVKVYPSWDDHHSSDGYRHPKVEVWRGVCANWWRQNPDGMHTFNLMFPSPESERGLGIEAAPEHRRGGLDGGAPLSDWETQCRVFAEIGSPETLEGRDKVFLVERRGGGHGSDFVPAPDDWRTPRHCYFQTNMRAQLPAALGGGGSPDTLLTLDVADDLAAAADRLDSLTLNLALTADPEEAAGGLQVEVRINNLLLGAPVRETGTATRLNARFEHWLIFAVPPRFLALGENLVGICRTDRTTAGARIEKLELHVRYA